jgi:serine/threonine protein phosphatase PrpC
LHCQASPELGAPRDLREVALVLTTDDIPAHLRTRRAGSAPGGAGAGSGGGGGGGAVQVYKGTYAANDPNEDRSTVAIGEDFVFAGVWDGHGGWSASDFSERAVWLHFQAACRRGLDPERAFEFAYAATDQQYLQHARVKAKETEGRPTELFAGTCAVGTYVDLRTGMIHAGNLGDSRAVFGVMEGGRITSVQPLSWDHSCDEDSERKRVRAEHPGDYEATINCGGEEGEPDDWRVKGVCAFTRSIGDFQMKDKAAAARYNTHTKGYQVVPRPGTIPDGHTDPVKPYIIHEPTVETQAVTDGVLVVASDGVWDEISNEKAANTVCKVSTPL